MSNSSTNWRDNVIQHSKTNREYSLRDLQDHFTTKEQIAELADFTRRNGHKRMRDFLQTSSDWNAFIPPALLSTVANYGLVEELPQGLINTVPEERASTTCRFVWKSEGVEFYQEGEPFKETAIEGAANTITFFKAGAKLSETRETAMDMPLSTMQLNTTLTVNEFKAKDLKMFSHCLHENTSNLFDIRAVLKDGTYFDTKWRKLHSNAYDADETEFTTWADIRNARAAQLRRPRDGVRPTVCIINASTEAYLIETFASAFAAGVFFGVGQDIFSGGALPNVNGLQFYVTSDANHGYFTNNITRKNDTFVQTNDAFLIAPQGTILYHQREPLSTESWQQFEGQRNNINIWQRGNFSVYRHTNIMRIAKPQPGDEYGTFVE